MSNISQFGGGGVKSIQRGIIALGGIATATATISSVNTAKSELRYLGVKSNGGTAASVCANLTLTNSTTITANTNTASAGVLDVSWELTEFY